MTGEKREAREDMSGDDNREQRIGGNNSKCGRRMRSKLQGANGALDNLVFSA